MGKRDKKGASIFIQVGAFAIILGLNLSSTSSSLQKNCATRAVKNIKNFGFTVKYKDSYNIYGMFLFFFFYNLFYSIIYLLVI